MQGAKQADEALWPVRGGIDATEQVDKDDEGVMDFALLLWQQRVLEKVRTEVRRLFARELELEDEEAVPEPGVMGGGVSQHAEVVHERAEGLLIHAKGRGDGLTDGGLAQLTEKRGNIPEGGDLHDDPGGRPRHEERAAVVLDKVLFAALHFIVKLHECQA